jgi:hypothetical protein
MKSELTSEQLDKLTEIQFLDSFEERAQAIAGLSVPELMALETACHQLADRQIAIVRQVDARIRELISCD